MSASLNTFIELEGTLKEIKAMIVAIKGYCSCNQDVSLDSPRIHHKKKFDGKNGSLKRLHMTLLKRNTKENIL